MMAIIKSNSTRKILANQIIKKTQNCRYLPFGYENGSDKSSSSMQGYETIKKAGIKLVVYEPSILKMNFMGRVEPDYIIQEKWT